MSSMFPGLTGHRKRMRPAAHITMFVSLSLILAVGSVCSAQNGEKVVEARLKFRKYVYARGAVQTEFLESKVEFKKEPDYAGSDIVRGAMIYGPEPGNIVGYAFDVKNEKLYLDSNINLDLTDDPVHRVEALPGGHFELYEGLEVRIPRGELEVPYNMDFSYSYGDVHMSVASGWQGKVELGGETWRLSVIDNLDGSLGGDDMLLIEPVRADKKGRGTCDLDFVDMAFPERLFFQGTNYELSAEIVPGKREPKLLLKLREVDSPTAVLDVEGERIRWLLLEGPQSALLESPNGTVVVPATNYDAFSQSVVLVDDSEEFYRSYGNTDLRLSSGETSSFKMGAPLKNLVSVEYSGPVLALDYSLVGIGGEVYEALNCDDDIEALLDGTVDGPGFAIYKDGEELGTGNFEYGRDGIHKYRWRVPITEFGAFSVVASKELGGLGPTQGAVVEYNSSIWIHLAKAVPLALLVLWVAIAGMRNRKELLLIIPLLVVAAPLMVGIEAVASFEAVSAPMFMFVEIVVGIVFAVGVLHMPFDFLACSSSKLSFFKSGMVLIFMGTLFAMLLGVGSITGGILAAIVLTEMVLGGLLTRYILRKKQDLKLFFPVFLTVFTLVCAISCTVYILIKYASFIGYGMPVSFVFGCGIASAFFAVLVWMSLTPFMLLDVFVPTYGERFSRLLWTPPVIESVEECDSASDEVVVEA